jgi:drug/metabolite transporter (DMT)-like permease
VKKGYVYIALAAFLFSTMEIALKLYSLGLNPIQLNLLRFSVGALVLLGPSIRSLEKRGLRLGGPDFAFFALTGFLCVVVSMTLYQLAVARGRASLVAVLFSCNPVFVIPLAALFLGERLTGKTALSLAASLAGMALIAVPLFLSKAGGEGGAVALSLLSALVFALYGVVGKTRSARYGGLALTCMSFIMGCLELLALIAISHIAPIAGALRGSGLSAFAAIPILSGLTLAGLPGFLYIAIFVTGLGFAFYFLGIDTMGATKGSFVFFIKPALAPLLALAVLGEALSPAMIGGILLILAGSGVGLIPGRKTA